MRGLAAAALLLASGAAGAAAPAQTPAARIATAVDYRPPVGGGADGAARFVDAGGSPARLREQWRDVPLVLLLAWYRCENLCGVALEALARAARATERRPGRDYAIGVVSIDPAEGPAEARGVRERLAARHPGAGVEDGWRFLTGPPGSIDRLARSVGFRYRYDPARAQYAHPAGLVVLAPGGTVSGYLPGVDYPPAALDAALRAAAGGAPPEPSSPLALLCYDYDPQTGRYSLAVRKLVAVGAAVTALVVAGGVGAALRRERRRDPS